MSPLVHRRLRAPQDDGAALIDPPPGEFAQILDRNRQAAARFDERSGLPPRLRKLARMTVVPRPDDQRSDAQLEIDAERPIILSGHQPELFHPGVWFKNFLIAAIARSASGWAVNLVVDNDEVRTTAVRVPTRVGGSPQVIEVPFDAPGAARPWENRLILDIDRFRNFANETRRALEPVIAQRAEFQQGIVLDRYWEYAIQEMESQKQRSLEQDKKLGLEDEYSGAVNLSRVLSGARSRLERDWGLALHDYRVRRFGLDIAFCAFAGLLFSRYREMHAIYNAALAEFRHVNHVRSRSHPVPELAVAGDWLEMPFWVWTIRDFGRRRVFVRQRADAIELTDHKDVLLRLPRDSSDYCTSLIKAGIHLRPRALITTMYARLVLSDLFIHGIGGAKYDELTDLIIRRFFGIEPPAYVTATATFRLPIERPHVSIDDVRASGRRMRDLRYRPESLLRDPLVNQDADLSPRLAALVAQKREFLDNHDLRRCSPAVFAQLDRLNRAMHDLLKPLEEKMRAERSELVAQLKQSQLLGSREFSFVLFPSEILPARLLDLCKVLS